MGLMLDSSVIIAAERARQTPEAMFEGIGEKHGDIELTLSVISAAELLHGCWRASDPVRRARREQFVEEVIAQTLVVAVDLPTARAFAEIDAKLAAAGTPIEVEDLLIGCSALVRGDELLTTNVKHFTRIPGLVVRAYP